MHTTTVRRRRTGRRVLLVVLALLVVALSGCSIQKTEATRDALQRAGFHSPSVELEVGTGDPADGLVAITYRSGPSGNGEAVAGLAAQITWKTLPYRMGAISVTQASGGCVGPACASSSEGLGSESYAQLQAMFGPRSASLDQQTVSSVVGSLFKKVLIFGGIGLLVAAALVIFFVVRNRRKPSAPWTGFTPPPGGPVWSQPPGSPSGQPPPTGWGRPPDGSPPDATRS